MPIVPEPHKRKERECLREEAKNEKKTKSRNSGIYQQKREEDRD